MRGSRTSRFVVSLVFATEATLGLGRLIEHQVAAPDDTPVVFLRSGCDFAAAAFECISTAGNEHVIAVPIDLADERMWSACRRAQGLAAAAQPWIGALPSSVYCVALASWAGRELERLDPDLHTPTLSWLGQTSIGFTPEQASQLHVRCPSVP